MGTLRSVLLLTTGAVIGGAVFIAYRVSQETGKPLLEAFADVPGEMQRLTEDLKERVCAAIERGREVYLQKQEEIDEQLR